MKNSLSILARENIRSSLYDLYSGTEALNHGLHSFHIASVCDHSHILENPLHPCLIFKDFIKSWYLLSINFIPCCYLFPVGFQANLLCPSWNLCWLPHFTYRICCVYFNIFILKSILHTTFPC